MARIFHLSAYDATYLDLAQRQRLPLATLDERLREGRVSTWFAERVVATRIRFTARSAGVAEPSPRPGWDKRRNSSGGCWWTADAWDRPRDDSHAHAIQ